MRDKIIIADDMKLNRKVLAEIVKDHYTVFEAENGVQALAFLENNADSIAAILLDLIMPEMDGFQFLEELKERDLIKRIPVLIISSEQSPATEKRCFECGVIDFVRKPFDKELIELRIKNITEMYNGREEYENKVKRQNEQMKKQYMQLIRQAEDLRTANENLIEVVGNVTESISGDSPDHVKKIKRYTYVLAREVMKSCPEYNLDMKTVRIITATSAMHDLGKLAIPDSIRLKPGKLTEEEHEYMKSHTLRGCELLQNVRDIWNMEYATAAYEICRYHHERYDGNGYPDGLKGNAIPLSAQIVGICDQYDELVTETIYKAAYPKDQAFKMIVTGEKGIFSPRLIDCFRNVRSTFEEIADGKQIEDMEENGNEKKEGSTFFS